ncbi:hypothetical protein [Rubrivirga sp. IMCC45206]|uniref:hypothetical protein n=1 Tax=Rubrivirga sp. IMCC45206 TaxID=3391614 RepID=UPI00398FACB4
MRDLSPPAEGDGGAVAISPPDLPLLVRPADAVSIGQHLAFVERMVAQGGPRPGEYAAFDRWLAYVASELRTGRIADGELRAVRAAFGPALSLGTNQGLSLRKPHGYSGDFEIIDRMYREHVTDDPDLRNWDLYFHSQAGPRAVRNRKAYVVDLLGAFAQSGGARVLNVASGPARDVAEFFGDAGGSATGVAVDCVDADADAIAYARHVCAPYLDRVAFYHANALRFTSAHRYGLIWSAGLFDYFGDRGFKFLLERLLEMLAEGGELVVGNFCENATRDYMEVIGDWELHYRSEDELIELAMACGVAPEDIRIGREPQGINLFLHIKRGPSFLPMTEEAS